MVGASVCDLPVNSELVIARVAVFGLIASDPEPLVPRLVVGGKNGVTGRVADGRVPMDESKDVRW